jgi:ABC-type sugar transport system ATPase subunit
MAEVVLDGVYKSFGKIDVIRDVNLDIKNNEFVVFVGPSGCGKSTLLRLVAGLEDATGGDILIDGDRVNALPPARRGIAMVFQSYALYPHMTVYDNMAFGLRRIRTDDKTIDEKVREAAGILELTPLLDRLPRELSGGQRQRVAIGRAIVRDPKVFLFDEPLSNLDAALRVQMRLEIAQLHRRMQATMIYVTHDQVEAMTLADRIVVLNKGRVEQFGRPLDLYHRPANLFVAQFIGSPRMNVVDAEVSSLSGGGVEVRVPGGRTARVAASAGALSVGDAVTLGIRPEHITVVPEGEPHEFAGTADVVEGLGDSHLIHVSADGGVPIVVKANGDATVREGTRVHLAFTAEDARLFHADGTAVPVTAREPEPA